MMNSLKRQCSIVFVATLLFFLQFYQQEGQEFKPVIDSDYYEQQPLTAKTVQLCGITVILGDYEKSPKEPLEPLDPQFPMFLITDQEHLMHPPLNTNTTPATVWTRV
jgi:hypothetical protein